MSSLRPSLYHLRRRNSYGANTGAHNFAISLFEESDMLEFMSPASRGIHYGQLP